MTNPTNITMTTATSTMVTAFAILSLSHGAREQVLLLQFPGTGAGRLHAFVCPTSLVEAFSAAAAKGESLGKFVNQHVKGKMPGARVEAATEESVRAALTAKFNAPIPAMRPVSRPPLNPAQVFALRHTGHPLAGVLGF